MGEFRGPHLRSVYSSSAKMNRTAILYGKYSDQVRPQVPFKHNPKLGPYPSGGWLPYEGFWEMHSYTGQRSGFGLCHRWYDPRKHGMYNPGRAYQPDAVLGYSRLMDAKLKDVPGYIWFADGPFMEPLRDLTDGDG